MNPAPKPKVGRIDVKSPPPGRFLYSLTSSKEVAYEGRLLDSVPDDGFHWLKLQEGSEWLWSGDVNIEVHLAEPGAEKVGKGESEKGREVEPLPPLSPLPAFPPAAVAPSPKKPKFGQSHRSAE